VRCVVKVCVIDALVVERLLLDGAYLGAGVTDQLRQRRKTRFNWAPRTRPPEMGENRVSRLGSGNLSRFLERRPWVSVFRDQI